MKIFLTAFTIDSVAFWGFFGGTLLGFLESFLKAFEGILRVFWKLSVGSLLGFLDSLLQGFTNLTKLRLGSSPHVKWWGNTAIPRNWPYTNQKWIGGQSKAFSRWIGSLFRWGSWTRYHKKTSCPIDGARWQSGTRYNKKIRLFFWMSKQNKNLIPPSFLKSKKGRK